MNDDGLELLRTLLERVEQRQHSARPRFRPLRWRRRRTDPIDRTFMRFGYGSRERCRS